MKIAFDNQIFTKQSYGGISRIFANTAVELEQLGVGVRIIGGFHINNYLKELPKSITSGKYIESYPKRSLRVFNQLNKAWSSLEANKFKPDIIHETYFSFDSPIKKKKPVVVSVYDMIQEIFPQLFPEYELTTPEKKASLERADHIISISEHTKNDLVNLFGIQPDKISVVHLAADTLSQATANDYKEPERPFFLYVGGRRGYKNFKSLLRAFASSELLVKDFDIIAFGGMPFEKEEVELFHELGLNENKVRHESGADSYLAFLYSKAFAFIYPSLYEGFGIPPLEAMVNHCPVISSNTSSMPEVIGDAALFFDPREKEEMKNQMERLVLDSKLRQDLIKKGLSRSENFSWKKTAMETNKVYQKVLAS
ncbi:glycosyltransferase family 4 protein [Algoriphagus namhaensis]|uniref:Glycosyltransferase family 4 protein n=1 Tax=Algoriphagus namhaensis TaxID=915353 RepID=A0ABV8AVI0_9BACT